jgi:hypothetical protein
MGEVPMDGDFTVEIAGLTIQKWGYHGVMMCHGDDMI